MKTLRVLIVDDEQIVRHGLKKLLPWARYNMEVVGEAATGEAAMRFLAQNEVDVIFIDLNMPVMNGFELIKRVNMEYPDMIKVVLTCDADVKHIQRAIVGGIAGYILKTDFDNAEMEELFKRIRQIANRTEQRSTVYGLLIGVPREHWSGSAMQDCDVNWFSRDIALLRGRDSLLSLLPNEEGVMLSLQERDARRLLQAPQDVDAVIGRQIGYELTAGVRIYAFKELPPLSNEEANELDVQLRKGLWLLSLDECGALKARLYNCRYPLPAQVDALSALMDSMADVLCIDALKKDWVALSCSHIPTWLSICDVMDQMCAQMGQRLSQKKLSEDSAAAVLRALFIVQEPLHLFSTTDNIASQIGYSRSHFSRVFSRMMGISYKDYIRRMRMNTVRRLRQRGLSIDEIAGYVGYSNTEYFTRIYSDRLILSDEEEQ